MNQQLTMTKVWWVAPPLLCLLLIVYFATLPRTRGGRLPITVSVTAPPMSAAERDAHARYLVPVTSTQPSRGASDPIVTMVVWSDLRGEGLQQAEAALRSVVERHPEDVRWVFRHYFDRSAPEAHMLHHVARGAQHHGAKLWELRELTLGLTDDQMVGLVELKALAEHAGAPWPAIENDLSRMGFAKHVNADLTFAAKYGVTASHTAFVNGRRVAAEPRDSFAKRLDAMVDQELRTARDLVARGLARSQVYETLTRDGLWHVGDDPAQRLASSQADR